MDNSPMDRPLVLLGTDSEWTGRSLESVFDSNGYAVMLCRDGHRALELARRAAPDAVIVDESLGEIGGLEICRALRDDPSFDRATPIVVTTQAPAAKTALTAAYDAGAWDFCTQPIDVETLLLKLGTFIRAKRKSEVAQEGSRVDAARGLYRRAIS